MTGREKRADIKAMARSDARVNGFDEAIAVALGEAGAVLILKTKEVEEVHEEVAECEAASRRMGEAPSGDVAEEGAEVGAGPMSCLKLAAFIGGGVLKDVRRLPPRDMLGREERDPQRMVPSVTKHLADVLGDFEVAYLGERLKGAVLDDSRFEPLVPIEVVDLVIAVRS